MLLAFGLCAPLVCGGVGPTLRLQRRLLLFWVIYASSAAIIAYCALSGSDAWLPGRWPHLTVLVYGVFAMSTAVAWYYMDDEDIGDLLFMPPAGGYMPVDAQGQVANATQDQADFLQDAAIAPSAAAPTGHRRSRKQRT